MKIDMSKVVAGVICPNHGKVDLTWDNYMYQLRQVDSFWKCPVCNCHSDFDDDRYEELNFSEDTET